MENFNDTRPMVSISYCLNGLKQGAFESTADRGDLCDPNFVSEEAISNTSFSYSGRHDHGGLPTLRGEGYFLGLLCSLQESKDSLAEYIGTLEIVTRNPVISEDRAIELYDNENDEIRSAFKKVRPS